MDRKRKAEDSGSPQQSGNWAFEDIELFLAPESTQFSNHFGEPTTFQSQASTPSTSSANSAGLLSQNHLRQHPQVHHAQAPASPVSSLTMPHLQEINGPLAQFQRGSSGFGASSSPSSIAFQQARGRQTLSGPSVGNIMQLPELDPYTQYGSDHQFQPTYSLGDQHYYHDAQQGQHDMSQHQYTMEQGSYGGMINPSQGKMYQQQQQQQQPHFSPSADGQYYGNSSLDGYQYSSDGSVYPQSTPHFQNTAIAQIPEAPLPKGPVTAKQTKQAKPNPPKKQKSDLPIQMVPTAPIPPIVTATATPTPASLAPKPNGHLQTQAAGLAPRPQQPKTSLHPQLHSQTALSNFRASIRMNASAQAPLYINPLDSQPAGYIVEQIPASSSSSSQSLVSKDSPDFLLAAVQKALQDHVEEKVCLILNSKVAQKSYGNEKRFFCPPPSVMLLGDSWRENDQDPIVKIGIEEDGKDAQVGQLDGERCTVFKNLFISDSDKRKNFTLHVRITSPLGRDYGVFRSKPLKVISKPSKKKQPVKNVELAINHGTTVALFNRIRSQTVSTKYLGVEEGALVTRGSVWDAFTVTAVGKNPEPGEELTLQYGMEVILQSTLTGLNSPPLVIQKVEKSDNVVHCDESISQLHKVALQVKGSDRLYLSAVENAVTTEQSTMSASNEECLSDTASWTIVGTDRVRYCFMDHSLPPGAPITPIPVVETVKIQSKMLVEMHGENFNSNLVVWFGETPSKTRYRCEEYLTCEPPPYSELRDSKGAAYCTTRTTLPLLLVRNDGAVFPTGHKYTYQVEPVPFSR